MNFVFLKKIRIALSLLFFIAIILLFLDFIREYDGFLSSLILFFQFIPSGLRFFALFFTFSAIGFIIVVFLTLFFGRIYCAGFCPLGTLQDIFSFLAGKIKKSKYKYDSNSHDFIRYGLLIITFFLLIFGSTIAANFLDPYSVFGRGASNIISPIYVGINNGIALLLEKNNYYLIKPKTFHAVEVDYLILSIILFLLAAVLAAVKGRIYCNLICPVGSTLGLISRLSLYKLKIESDNCSGCGLCATKCKANCLDSETKTIDYSRCVMCFNCAAECKPKAFRFIRSKNIKPHVKINNNSSKREFIRKALGGIMGAISVSALIQRRENSGCGFVPVLKKFPVSPPGSQSIEKFSTYCSACSLCVAVCPTKVLRPSLFEYGWAGILQPVMDYNISFCNYECTKCSEVCPTGAIAPITLNEKKIIKIGSAVFIKDNCVVEVKRTECGACSEHCPTKAVKMVPYKGLYLPEVEQDICVGCGACEFACPTVPFKAIYVKSAEIHKKAKPLKKEIIEHNIDYKEDFPF